MEKCWCWITILFALTFYCLLSETRGQQPLQRSVSLNNAICNAMPKSTMQCAMQCKSVQWKVQCSSKMHTDHALHYIAVSLYNAMRNAMSGRAMQCVIQWTEAQRFILHC